MLHNCLQRTHTLTMGLLESKPNSLFETQASETHLWLEQPLLAVVELHMNHIVIGAMQLVIPLAFLAKHTFNTSTVHLNSLCDLRWGVWTRSLERSGLHGQMCGHPVSGTSPRCACACVMAGLVSGWAFGAELVSMRGALEATPQHNTLSFFLCNTGSRVWQLAS